MKKALIAIAAVLMIGLAALVVYLLMDNRQLEQERMEMQELAELDKQEMENDYERLSLQYTEMMTQINNDSIIAQLTQEQMRTQQLLQELKQVKANDAREITRLKKELATVREVLRSYIRQVDSLNQVNQNLMAENDRVSRELAQQSQANENAEPAQVTRAPIDLSGAPNDDITYLAANFNDLYVNTANLRNIFQKFVSKNVVDTAYHDHKVELKGEQRQLTILFTDIKGFTSRTEVLGNDITSQEVFDESHSIFVPITLDDVFTEIEKSKEGTLEDLINDGIMNEARDNAKKVIQQVFMAAGCEEVIVN